MRAWWYAAKQWKVIRIFVVLRAAAEVAGDFDEGSLLREIDNQLNEMSKDNRSTSSSNTPYDTAASDSDNAVTPEDVTMAARDVVDDNSFFDASETERDGTDSKPEEYRLIRPDLSTPEAYGRASLLPV